MKVIVGIIIGAIVGVSLFLFAYLYLGSFFNNSSNVIGKEPVVVNSPKTTLVKGKTTGIQEEKSNNESGNVSNNKGETTTLNNTVVKNEQEPVTSEKNVTNENNNLTTAAVQSSNPANFDVLLKGPYINGIIGGNSPVLISLNHPVISGGVMTLKEYYPKVPSETFTLKVISPEKNQFIMYEYYNGQHTGTYNLVLNDYVLSGTFEHCSNGLVSQVQLSIYGASGGFIGSTPFLKGVIGQTPVVICTGANTNNMTEFYPDSNPDNVFNVTIDFNNNSGNKVTLNEYYNGEKTGVYNGVMNSDGIITGTYTSLSSGIKSSFELNPSYTN
ncbi:MAG: hypothetical protein ACRDD2_13465 [Sarcina sp.]